MNIMRWLALVGALVVLMPLYGLAQDAVEPQIKPSLPIPAQAETVVEQPTILPEEVLSGEVPTAVPPAATSEAVPDATSSQPVDSELIQTRITDPSSLPHDLSPMGMFLAADLVVKSVLVGLGAASFATWTIWVAKSLQVTGARFRIKRALRLIGSAKTLAEARRSLQHKEGPGRGPAAMMVHAASLEVELSSDMIINAGGEGLKERVTSSLSRIEAATARRVSKGVGLLATIGSTAPFVGLFGTVWGIMNAFIGISESQTTNLAVVAPGIAEALLATAAGLIAAIPAVVIYNIFARSIAGYRHLLGDAAAGIERLVSRDVDYRYAFDADDGAVNIHVTV